MELLQALEELEPFLPFLAFTSSTNSSLDSSLAFTLGSSLTFAGALLVPSSIMALLELTLVME